MYKTCTACTCILMFKTLDILYEVKIYYTIFSKWVSILINRCGVSPIHCPCQNYGYRLQMPILWTMCGQLGHPEWSPPTSPHWGRQKSCPVIYQPALLIFQGFCRVNMCERLKAVYWFSDMPLLACNVIKELNDLKARGL